MNIGNFEIESLIIPLMISIISIIFQSTIQSISKKNVKEIIQCLIFGVMSFITIIIIYDYTKDQNYNFLYTTITIFLAYHLSIFIINFKNKLLEIKLLFYTFKYKKINYFILLYRFFFKVTQNLFIGFIMVSIFELEYQTTYVEIIYLVSIILSIIITYIIKSQKYFNKMYLVRTYDDLTEYKEENETDILYLKKNSSTEYVYYLYNSDNRIIIENKRTMLTYEYNILSINSITRKLDLYVIIVEILHNYLQYIMKYLDLEVTEDDKNSLKNIEVFSKDNIFNELDILSRLFSKYEDIPTWEEIEEFINLNYINIDFSFIEEHYRYLKESKMSIYSRKKNLEKLNEFKSKIEYLLQTRIQDYNKYMVELSEKVDQHLNK